jgi:hypothetical protein
MRGPTRIFWANLTRFRSRSRSVRRLVHPGAPRLAAHSRASTESIIITYNVIIAHCIRTRRTIHSFISLSGNYSSMVFQNSCPLEPVLLACALLLVAAVSCGRCREKCVRLAQNIQVGPCISVGIQLEKAEVGPASGPTWRLSHLKRRAIRSSSFSLVAWPQSCRPMSLAAAPSLAHASRGESKHRGILTLHGARDVLHQPRQV